MPRISLLRAAILALALLAGFGAQRAWAQADGAWSADASLSLTAQTGTTDSVAGTVDLKADRDTERNELGVRFNGVYGTTRSRPGGTDEITQNSQALTGDWKHILAKRFFIESTAEASRDTVQDREARAAVTVGPGWRAWRGGDPAKEHLDLVAGVGYRYELYNVTTVTFPDRDNYDEDQFVDLVAAFEYKNMLFEDRIEFTHTGRVKLPANDAEAYILTTEAIIGVPVSESWSLRIGFFAEYQNVQPQRVQNTTTRTTVGLGYKF